MFSKFFQDGGWLNVFAIATMFLFIAAFIVMLIWVFRIDRNEIEKQSKLPLKD